MVRKTKEHAELTRQKIIDAAREVFLTKGVSKTSLEQIAKHAGVTRGAVYWHFENKAQIIHAMREAVFLPLIDRMEDTLLLVANNESIPNDSLSRIEQFLLGTIQDLNDNLKNRQTFIVMMTKCEYVGEFEIILKEILTNCAHITSKFKDCYAQAKQKGILNNESLSPEELAMDTHLFFTGVLHMWVKDEDGGSIRNNAENLIKSHIKLRRKHL
jgi:TetR/AcrR family acrAB operon transcriptional repressor